MSKRERHLRDQVVVITGASSGVGRATAVEFATHGARVVLAARRADDLEETARQCRAAGGVAMVVVTDVTQEADVHALAEAARARFQRIDVWINNAGVTTFAPLAAGPFDDHRRVIETNLFGAMHGVRAAIPIFRAQQKGVLINVGSVLGKVGHPFVPSYSISKFALRGLSECIRAELSDEPEIHVCTIFPFTIDTPHFQTGANRLGKQARALPPLQSPEKVARAIVGLALRPRRELHVPRILSLGLALNFLFPHTTERLLLHTLRRWHFDDRPEPTTQGGLYHPVEQGEGRTHGKRPPQLGLPTLLAWAAGELVRMKVDGMARQLGRPRAVGRPSSESTLASGQL